jgi:F-type H+-transporting ATPase subunit delta
MSKDLGIVAKRYALAIFDIAKEQNTIDQIEQQLVTVKNTLQNSDELTAVLEHPKVTKGKKKQLLNDVFSSIISKEVLNTLYLLVDRKREEVVAELVSQYTLLANEERGIADAVVYTVKPLSESELSALTQAFSKRLGKKSLRIQNIVDEKLVGGVKLVAENQVFDGSVLGQLTRIQRELTTV